MRLLLVCTALCVAGAITSVSELPQPILFSQTPPSTVVTLASDQPVQSAAVIPFHSEMSPVPTAEAGPVDIVESPSESEMFPVPTSEPGPIEIVESPSELGELDDNAQALLAADVPEEPKAFTRSELCHTAASVATANNLPIPFFANLIQQESGFRPHVVSSAGAQGIAQFMPQVAASNGLANPFDPIESLTASGKFVARLVNQFGSLGLAAAAYNAGSQRVHDWIAKRRKLPAETRHYVHKITGLPAEAWARKLVRGPEVRLPPHARCRDALTLQAQAKELTKPVVQFNPPVSAAKRQAAIGVRRSMPQRSQFAMGLPASRFAAKATPVVETKAQDRHSSEEVQPTVRHDTKGGERITPQVKSASKITPQSIRVAIAH
jgi:hypothetical protein